MADLQRAPLRPPLVLSPPPHLGVSLSSAVMAWLVAVSLAPAAAWGVFLFGLPALLVLGVAVVSAVLAELLSWPFIRRFSLHDGSAVLTGLFVGALMPAGVPLYVPAAASLFAILVVKQSFGGHGRNWMNPALGGVVFALLSWGSGMGSWTAVRVSGQGAALPMLDAVRAAAASGRSVGAAPLAILQGSGYQFSAMDGTVVSWVNTHVLSALGMALPSGSIDLILGFSPGRIGALSVPILMLGAGFLLWRRVVRWHVPVSLIAVFALLAWIFGGLSTGRGWLAGSPGFHIFSGSLVFGAFYLAGDPITSPLTRRGQWVYGCGLGALAFLLRFFGSLGDGVAVALLLGNCAVPLLDRVSQRKAAPGEAIP